MIDVTMYEIQLRLTTDLLGTVPKNKEVYASFIQKKARELLEKEKAKGIPLTDGRLQTEHPAALEERMAEEVETVEGVEERGWTGFHADDNGVYLMDYAIKGFFKESARTLREYKMEVEGEDEDEGAAPDEEKAPAEDEAEEEAPKKGRKKAGAGTKAKKAPKEKKVSTAAVLKQLQDKISRYTFILPRRVYLAPPKAPLDSLERPLRAMTAQGPRVTLARSDVIKEGSLIDFKISVVRGAGIDHNLLFDVIDYGQYQGLGQWRSGGYGRFELTKFNKIDHREKRKPFDTNLKFKGLDNPQS